MNGTAGRPPLESWPFDAVGWCCSCHGFIRVADAYLPADSTTGARHVYCPPRLTLIPGGLS